MSIMHVYYGSACKSAHISYLVVDTLWRGAGEENWLMHAKYQVINFYPCSRGAINHHDDRFTQVHCIEAEDG